MKQTAVEWLEDNIERDMDYLEILYLIKHAKEMEKLENTNSLSNQSSISSHFEISDEVLFEQATVAMEEHYGYGCETEIDAYFRGAKWMQKNMYTEEQVREAMEFARGHSKMTDTQFIETLK